MRVLGLDACRGGWAGVLLNADGVAEGVFLRHLADADGFDVAGIGIDIPLGLAVDHVRRCDELARQALGPRRSSVFRTPVRSALEAADHAAASAENRRRTGSGISVQAWGLRAKVLEADAWARTVAVPVWEVHPELAFALLLGAPATHPKRTWAGQQERRAGLEAAGVHLDGIGPVGGVAGADDVLDAAAVAWSARRLVADEGRSWPDPPERYPGWPHPVAIHA